MINVAFHSTGDLKYTQTFTWLSNWCIFAKLKMCKIFQNKDQIQTFYEVLVVETKSSSTRKTRLLFCGVSVDKDQLVRTQIN